MLFVFLIGAGCSPPVWGLKPIYPEPALLRETDNSFVFTPVSTRWPEFKWEAFPRGQDLEAGHAGAGRKISEVTYELKIWEEDRAFPGTFDPGHEFAEPGPLVYARSGLPKPHHRIAMGLKWRTNYFWTVRARFLLDGQPRLTTWGVLGMPQSAVVSYYRFKTP